MYSEMNAETAQDAVWSYQLHGVGAHVTGNRMLMIMET